MYRNGYTLISCMKLTNRVTGSTSNCLEYYAVKECSVIISFLCKLEEVITMLWCLIIEANNDVAQRSLNFYFCHNACLIVVSLIFA